MGSPARKICADKADVVCHLWLDITISHRLFPLDAVWLDLNAMKVIACLKDSDRLVRNAAVLTIRELGIVDDDVVRTLRQIVIEDEPAIARKALVTLAELDKNILEELVAYLRSNQDPF